MYMRHYAPHSGQKVNKNLPIFIHYFKGGNKIGERRSARPMGYRRSRPRRRSNLSHAAEVGPSPGNSAIATVALPAGIGSGLVASKS
jgi:hypothetical protein